MEAAYNRTALIIKFGPIVSRRIERTKTRRPIGRMKSRVKSRPGVDSVQLMIRESINLFSQSIDDYFLKEFFRRRSTERID